MKILKSYRQVLWLAVFMDLLIASSAGFVYSVFRQPFPPLFYVAVLVQVLFTVQVWRKRDKPYPGEPRNLTPLQKVLIRIALIFAAVYVGYIFVTVYKAFVTLL